jgi:hypothetical protein
METTQTTAQSLAAEGIADYPKGFLFQRLRREPMPVPRPSSYAFPCPLTFCHTGVPRRLYHCRTLASFSTGAGGVWKRS